MWRPTRGTVRAIMCHLLLHHLLRSRRLWVVGRHVLLLCSKLMRLLLMELVLLLRRMLCTVLMRSMLLLWLM